LLKPELSGRLSAFLPPHTKDQPSTFLFFVNTNSISALAWQILFPVPSWFKPIGLNLNREFNGGLDFPRVENIPRIESMISE